MKRYISIFIILSATLFASRAQDFNGMWDRANTAYINSDYVSAISAYDSIMASGRVSYKLYYNIGNAYFKEGRIAQSILNYNRALKLSPTDNDVRYNLDVANGYVKDKIKVIPEFFLKRWIGEARQAMSANQWAVAGIVFFALMMASALLYLLTGKLPLRKTGFYAGIACLALFIFSTVNSIIEKRALTDAADAIVMISAAAVKSSPDTSSKDLFVLHEGTKVTIVSRLGAWCEIVIADGNKGWMEGKSIEAI